MARTCLLEIKNLSFSYAEEKEQEPLIRGLDLSLYAGEILLVSGYSGCGKSSLMKVINGVIPHIQKGRLSGQILCGGDDIMPCSVHERARVIGSVFQNPREQIIFDKVIDELVFPMENLKFSRALMQQMSVPVLERLNLDPEARTAALSGGEKQKLITASTLAMQQKILLLDEPLANLDQEAALELLRLLRQLSSDEGYAVMLIEHRLDLVRAFADRVLHFADGHKIYEKAADFFAKQKPDPISPSPRSEAPSPGPPLFEAEQLGYAAGGKEILKNINFRIARGSRLLISGDNGRGKTTLLDIIAGLRKPTSGRLKSALSKKERREKVGYVLQNPDYQLFMPSVREELFLSCKDRAWAEFLLKHFAFENLLERSPFSLSEGQKRKLGFACIMARCPEVLILDEPTVGLDDGAMKQLLEAVSLYEKNHGLTLISVSHDRRAIPFLGERKLCL